MSKDNGGPAFPYLETGDCGQREGMSIRDYFAAHASEADIEYFCPKGFNEEFVLERGDGTKEIRRRAAMWTREQARYLYADAMIEARKA